KIKKIPSRGAQLLRYSLPIYTFSASCSSGLQVVEERVALGPSNAPEPSRTYRFTLRNPNATNLNAEWLDVADSRLSQTAHVRWGQLTDQDSKTILLLPIVLQGVGYRWMLGPVSARGEVTLVYDALG